MKKLYILLAILGLLLISCEKDFDGSVKANSAPTLKLTAGPSDTTEVEMTRKKIRVPWYSNDADDYDLSYRYIVTTDTTISLDNGEASILDNEFLNGNWNQTTNMYANISFPFSSTNGDTANVKKKYITFEDSVFDQETGLFDSIIIVEKKVMYSRLFVYAVDESGARSSIETKEYARTNYKPFKCRLFSEKLDVQLVDPEGDYNTSVGEVNPFMILEKESNSWKNFDFRWLSEDPDGDVELEYSWKLEILKDDGSEYELVEEFDGWSRYAQRVSFDKTLFERARQSTNLVQDFKFSVKVRDDALVESDSIPYIKFKTFLPKLKKGVLILNSVKTSEYKPDKKRKLIPEPEAHLNFYKGLLEENGFVHEDEAGEETPFEQQYGIYNIDEEGDPTLMLISEYRLVIVTSDDWEKVFFNYESSASTDILTKYLNVGGKVFSIGPDLIQNTGTVTYSNFNENPDVNILSNNPFLMLGNGLYKLESSNGYERAPDSLNVDNYDCIGAKTFIHAPEYVPMRFDSVKTNAAFMYDKYSNSSGELTQRYRFRDNGLTVAGVSRFIINEGTPILSYYSIYDLVQDPDDETIYRDETGYEFSTVLPNSDEPLGKNYGTVGTTYVSPDGKYRTALISIPLFFMDNTPKEGEEMGPVSKNFKTLIEWFDVSEDPFVEE